MGKRALETAAADLTAYAVGEGVLFNGMGVTVSGGGMDCGESCSVVATLLSFFLAALGGFWGICAS
jgi:hypothetical protein